MLDVNLESLKVSEDVVGRSKPVDMPTLASDKGRRRARKGSHRSDASDSRKRNTSGNDSIGSGSGNVVEVFGSWPDAARPELCLGAGVGMIEAIGEETSGASTVVGQSEVGQEKLLQESLADAMLEAALGVSGSGGDVDQ